MTDADKAASLLAGGPGPLGYRHPTDPTTSSERLRQPRSCRGSIVLLMPSLPVGRPRVSEGERGRRLGAAIRDLRGQHGMSRPLLAERTHMSRNTLMAIEQGRVADPGIFTIASLIGALGVSLDALAQLASTGPGTAKKESPMTTGIVSVGYEGREIVEFFDDLRRRGVRTLVDVRLTPVSRRRGFSKTRLKEALESGGIEYLHYRELGNPKENRSAFRGKAIEQGRSRFRTLLLVPEAQVALGALGKRARQEVVAVLCFEKNHDACHRKVVIDAVNADGPVPVVTA